MITNPRRCKKGINSIKAMKKFLYVIAATLCLVACEKKTLDDNSANNSDYVDLGLPSGTKWKVVNELNPQDSNGFYTFYGACNAFGKSLPTKEQWQELKKNCTWEWNENEYIVKGSNGMSIVLPAAGCRKGDGSVYYVGSCGYYWSSTSGSNDAWGLYFTSNGVGVPASPSYYGCSIRLVR